jgi:hypothetical protein
LFLAAHLEKATQSNPAGVPTKRGGPTEKMMTKTLTWGPTETARPWSATLLYVVAAVLRAASDALARRADVAATVEAVPAAAEVVEFHALHRDAGAPEGALYVNGVLVGVITGVSRL